MGLNRNLDINRRTSRESFLTGVAGGGSITLGSKMPRRSVSAHSFGGGGGGEPGISYTRFLIIESGHLDYLECCAVNDEDGTFDVEAIEFVAKPQMLRPSSWDILTTADGWEYTPSGFSRRLKYWLGTPGILNDTGLVAGDNTVERIEPAYIELPEGIDTLTAIEMEAYCIFGLAKTTTINLADEGGDVIPFETSFVDANFAVRRWEQLLTRVNPCLNGATSRMLIPGTNYT